MHSKTIIFVTLCVLYGFATSVDGKPFQDVNADYQQMESNIQKINRNGTTSYDDLENLTFSEHNENEINDEEPPSSSRNPSRVGFGHLLKALAIWNAVREYNLYGDKNVILPNTDLNQETLITSD